MRVTIIQAPQMVSLSNYLTTAVIPPLGLAYVMASLERDGHQVQFVDGLGEALTRFSRFGHYHLRGLSHDEVVARVDPRVELIGLGCMFTPQWPSLRILVDKLRAAYPKAAIMVGGEHATAMPEHVLATSRADFVVLGEGEETAVALAGALQTGEPIGEMPGLAYRVNGSVQKNRARQRVRDIDSIPWPAWQHVNVQAYIEYNQPHGGPLGRSMPMLATRGCPYQCTFCSSPQMWTTRWIARSVKDVVDEIEHNMAAFGADDFHFEDLTLIVKRGWILDFCRAIVDRGLDGKITWQLPSGTRAEAIDLEVMTWMQKAGAKLLSYAPEFGSERMRQLVKKEINIEHVMKAARHAVRRKMALQANFVVGHHEEAGWDILQTYWLLVRCAWVGFTEVHLACFYPLPNTEDWEKLRATGRLPEAGDELFLQIFQGADCFRPVSWNERLTDRQMRLLILFGYALFYGLSWIIRPWRFARLVFNLSTGRATNKTERILKGTLRKHELFARAQAGR